jgi:hypothetical protein
MLVGNVEHPRPEGTLAIHPVGRLPEHVAAVLVTAQRFGWIDAFTVESESATSKLRLAGEAVRPLGRRVA